LRDFGEECTQIPLLCDSTSAISVAKNPVLHSRTKHIEVRYHFLRDNVEKGTIVLSDVPTQDQLADIFAKPLDQATFVRLRGNLGFVALSSCFLGDLLLYYMYHTMFSFDVYTCFA
jgi:hypothetical protein